MAFLVVKKIMNNENKIVELSKPIMGRRKIKVVLHEIYPDRNHWNENGITYLEQYTRDNADTVKGMPLCAEFLDDDKDVPHGHGLTGNIGNLPVFENSVQVGSFEDWSIEDIEIDGEMHRCLCATGYVNENRYPHFVDWLADQVEMGKTVYGSVEFCGTKDNDGEIIYDGGWKEKGRVPMIYDYIGFSLINIRPADSSAIMIELNQQRVTEDEFDVFASNKMEKNSADEFGLAVQSNEKMTKTEYDDLIAWNLENESKCDDSDENFENVFE